MGNEFADDVMLYRGQRGRLKAWGRKIGDELRKIFAVIGNGVRRRVFNGAEVREIFFDGLDHETVFDALSSIDAEFGPCACLGASFRMLGWCELERRCCGAALILPKWGDLQTRRIDVRATEIRIWRRRGLVLPVG